jgi:multiple sugar transport system permease protein
MGAATWIFMMRQYLMGIPKEISDAGYIDGANEFQIFSRLILPVMKPVIGVIAIFAAIGSWNDFLTPLIYLHDQSVYPLSIGIQLFKSEHTVEYSMLMAASAMVVLPVIVIFLIFQRFFVEGITLGAVKG